MPSAIRVNMLSERLRTDAQPRTKNGQPAHSTTGRGEHELKPDRDLRRDVVVQVEAREMRSHFQDDRRRRRARRRSRNAGSCRASSGFGPVASAGASRLERHAADRAGAGPILPNLGMHRAGVDGAGRSLRLRRRLAGRQIFFRIGGELAPASARAEEIGETMVAVAVRGLVRIDLHAADRVEGGPRLRHSARAQRVPFSLRLETGTG